MLMNPGPAIDISSKVLSELRLSTTSSAIFLGAFPYFLAAASAPLHWNWQRSGLLETLTLPYCLSYPFSSNFVDTI